MSDPTSGAAALTMTSRRIRGAIGGDRTDLDWVVERLTPALLHQARYRMRERLVRVCDPEDVVSYAWQVALPKLPAIIARGGRFTPVLLKFLSTAILLRVNELLRRAAAAPPMRSIDATPAGDSAIGAPADPPDPSPGVWTEIVRRERRGAVQEALDSLEAHDREVIVLRLVEQHSSSQTATILGIEPSAVNVRLHRALDRLRKRIPDSVFDDVVAESA